jgi:hypothetical protein
VTTHQSIFQLAEQQLPAAAMLGLGDELATVADGVREDERVIRIATAYDGDAFGVLALTDRRVLWAAAGLATGTIVLAWPRDHVRVMAADDGVPCIEVDDERWRFSRILPADAVDELVDQLSDCEVASKAVAVAAE